MKMKTLTVLLLFLLAGRVFAAEPLIDCVEVKTRSSENSLVKVWYRVPKSYEAKAKGLSRVLILFGGRNCDGKIEVSGKLGWTEWADQNGIFLVAPTFKDDDYWEPAKWSGRAIEDALAQIAAKYRIATAGLLYYGYSAGSQASNLFPAWRPDLCRAYVSHACGVFHVPTVKMKGVAACVTCGDADDARYVLGRRFVNQCRQLGVSVVWKSFPNHPHDVPPGSIRLAKAFLSHYHRAHPEDLGYSAVRGIKDVGFIGDDADGVYYPAGGRDAADIPAEDRVELPSESVALAWGAPGRTHERRKRKVNISTREVNGVEVVFAVPSEVSRDSRILLVFGGRGWDGDRSLKELGFFRWAVAKNWCLVSPSFSKGEYWEMQSGSAEVVRAAVRQLRKKHSLSSRPVFLFGYSAGGQLVSLLQEHDPKFADAWAVYGCGVYPETARSRTPGLIACGIGDEDRLRISRDYAYRFREAGGLLVMKPVAGGHELSELALSLAREFFEAIDAGLAPVAWGEDDTLVIRPREAIDIEFRNPLYGAKMPELWQTPPK